MPRAARIVVPDVPHHVTQRGNNRQGVFFVEADYHAYLAILREQPERFSLRIAAYCLMTNHVHLVAVPPAPQSLSLGVGRTNLKYALYLHHLHARSGHLWQDRFWSCALDAAHFRAAVIYVERNPVRAGMVRRPWDYPWSSAEAHCTGRDASGVLDMASWRARLDDGQEWRDLLAGRQDDAMLARLRSATMRNRPLGSDSFLSKLEVLIGRRLRPRPRGRPRKEEQRDGK